MSLPNEIWTLIWKYHYKNVRILAAKKKKHINDMIKSFSFDEYALGCKYDSDSDLEDCGVLCDFFD